jgi:hypothetical protein
MEDAPNIGDIIGIIRIITQTAIDYSEALKLPQPKLCFVGGVLVRPTVNSMFKSIFKPSFQQAKSIGYRGSYERWEELVKEQAAHSL